MLQLLKEVSITGKLLISLTKLMNKAFISEVFELTIRTKQLIVLSLARARSMMP